MQTRSLGSAAPKERPSQPRSVLGEHGARCDVALDQYVVWPEYAEARHAHSRVELAEHG